jgi:hypothetical protein
MQFTRRPKVPKFTNYQDYRTILQEDFLHHCAYCTVHEDEIAGDDFFEIDHHRPQSRPEFSHLISEYSNLYWSCHACNKRGAKGENWPSDVLYNASFRFFDPVAENAYQIHMRETGSGRLIKKTNTGDYSIQILRLNREGLVKLRRGRKGIRVMLRRELRRLLRVLERTKKLDHDPSQAILDRLDLVRRRLRTPPVLNLLPDWWHA